MNRSEALGLGPSCLGGMGLFLVPAQESRAPLALEKGQKSLNWVLS